MAASNFSRDVGGFGVVGGVGLFGMLVDLRVRVSCSRWRVEEYGAGSSELWNLYQAAGITAGAKGLFASLGFTGLRRVGLRGFGL